MKGKLVLGALIAIILGGSAAVAHALSPNIQSGNDITIGPNETVDSSLYVAGRSIDIAGTVNGDIFCAGQTITISGTVNGDIFCAGQNMHVSGTVNGSIRSAAQNVSIAAGISHNVTLAGQEVTLEPAAKVAGDATIAAQSAVFNGSVGRDVLGAATDLTVNGTVGRDVRSAVSTLRLGSPATVGGSIEYVSAQQLQQAPGARVSGTVTRKEPVQRERQARAASSLLIFALIAALSLLILALVLTLIFPYAFERVYAVAARQPVLTLLVGLAATIIVPVFLLVLFVSVVGIPLAVLLTLTWISMVLVAGPLAAYYLGHVLLKERTKNVLLYMLTGALILLVLTFIPLIGVIVDMLALWFGIGSIVMQVPRLPRPRYEIGLLHAVQATDTPDT